MIDLATVKVRDYVDTPPKRGVCQGWLRNGGEVTRVLVSLTGDKARHYEIQDNPAVIGKYHGMWTLAAFDPKDCTKA